VAAAREGAGHERPWHQILHQAERPVLLYEPRSLNATTVLLVLRDRPLSLPPV